MKILSIVLFALLAKIVVPETTGTEQLHRNVNEETQIVWINLYVRITKILNETTDLSEGLMTLNKRLDTQERQSTDFMEKMLDYSKDLNKRLDDSMELNKRLDTQELKLAQFMEISLNHTVDLSKSLTEFMENTETHLAYLKKKQDAQEPLLKHYFNLDWTTIFRRQDGSVDFYRNWTEYQKGFGNPTGEFFIGLERLHAMTSTRAAQELIVILRDFVNQEKIAKYDLFRIGNEAEKYAIKELGTCSGDAGNSLEYHKGSKFSTYDQKNDDSTSTNCAEVFKGAWWFDSCYYSHLFGPYKSEEESNNHGVTWKGFKGTRLYSMKFAEMKIRPKIF